MVEAWVDEFEEDEANLRNAQIQNNEISKRRKWGMAKTKLM